jgi:lipoic acid synthetase
MSKLPQWLIKRTPKAQNIRHLRSVINDPSIHTVCESAKCPNIGECYSKRTMTFMILGENCTRSCRFCAVQKGTPSPVDPSEHHRVAEAAKKLGLSYVVITSVTRDDLEDGGASQFAKTINEVRDARVEVLIPDFQGNADSLKKVVDAKPDVINHNVETVPKLYPQIRPQADYKRSLTLLKRVKDMDGNICTKSGLMVGLSESFEEVEGVLKDLFSAGVDIVTIGQYIPPSKDHAPVAEYIKPEIFDRYREFGIGYGLKEVFSGPFVRSSYHAAEILALSEVQKGRSRRA